MVMVLVKDGVINGCSIGIRMVGFFIDFFFILGLNIVVLISEGYVVIIINFIGFEGYGDCECKCIYDFYLICY